jgi:hypothetical protein
LSSACAFHGGTRDGFGVLSAIAIGSSVMVATPCALSYKTEFSHHVPSLESRRQYGRLETDLEQR